MKVFSTIASRFITVVLVELYLNVSYALAGIGANNAWLDDEAIYSKADSPATTFISLLIFLAFLINAPAITLGLISLLSLLACIFSQKTMLFGIISLASGLAAFVIDKKTKFTDKISIKCESCGASNNGNSWECANCGWGLVGTWSKTDFEKFNELHETTHRKIQDMKSKLSAKSNGETLDKVKSLKWILLSTIGIWVAYTYKFGFLAFVSFWVLVFSVIGYFSAKSDHYKKVQNIKTTIKLLELELEKNLHIRNNSSAQRTRIGQCEERTTTLSGVGQARQA